MINNEQRYIDDWLEYNFNIGVDKIILYEDYVSNPHNLSKYGEKVKLLRLPNCFNEYERFLMRKHIYRQYIAYQHFNRVYRNECDWFFFVDVDEYIEVDNIKQFIEEYQQYDQICVGYKMYGWDGHIYDPYPGQSYSTRKTYKQVVELKKCINALAVPLKSIVKSKSMVPYLWTKCVCIPHYFTNNNVVKIENKLAHYWTRSLEEYIWRVNKAGLMMKANWNRTYDNFFVLNNINIADYEKYIKEFTNNYSDKIKINDNF